MRLAAEHGRLAPRVVPGSLPPAFAVRAARVLGVLDLVVIDRRTGTVLDAAGPGRGLDVPAPPAWPGAIHDHRSSGGRGWIGVAPVGEPALDLHASVGSGWELDGRRRRMLQVIAAMAVKLARRAGEAPARVLERDCAQQVLAEQALTVETYADVVAVVTAVAAPLQDAARGGVAIWHPERRFLELLPGSFGAADAVVASSRVPASDTRSIAARAVTGGRALYTNRARADLPWFRGHLLGMGLTQVLCVPLAAPDGRIIGVLHLGNHRNGFTEADADELEPMLAAIAGMVERVRDRATLQDREALAAAVGLVATAIAHGQPLARLGGLLREFCTALRAQLLVVTFHDGTPPLEVATHELEDDVRAAFHEASRHGSRAVRTSMRPPGSAGDPGTSAQHTPVLVGGELLATLSILRRPYEPFVAHERDAIHRLTGVVSLARTTESYHRERAEIVRLRERQRIADDLHDHVAQILYSGQLQVQSVLERLGERSEIVPPLARAVGLLIRGQSAVRAVIEELTEPSATPFAGRLAEVVHSVEDEFVKHVRLDVAPEAAAAADQATAEIADVLLRVAREGLVNAAKHAGPCELRTSLHLDPDDRLVLAVEDTGVGLADDHDAGYGLTALRRRVRAQGGALRLGRCKPGGTRLTVSFPAR